MDTAATPETIVAMLASVDPSLYPELSNHLASSSAATNLIKFLNFPPPDTSSNHPLPPFTDPISPDMNIIKEEETKEQPHHNIKLPPILENFRILNETPQVHSLLSDPKFIAAQLSVQTTPNDQDSVATLASMLIPLISAYQAAITLKFQEEHFLKICRSVVYAGNEDFIGVYENMWKMTTKSDVEGCEKYKLALLMLLALPATANGSRQTTKDPATLFQHAALIVSTFQDTMRAMATSVDGAEISLPINLKKMGRVIEKILLKRSRDDAGSADRVNDVVRGMITCDNMSQLAAVVDAIREDEKIEVVRVKDRFFSCPSAGEFYFLDVELLLLLLY